MAAVIRLARHGGKKNPFYRIIVTDRRNAGDGNRLEQIGTYDPQQTPSRIEFKAERLAAWLQRGAKPSATVAQLIVRSGVTLAPEPGSGGHHEGAGPVSGAPVGQ
jgi:small subunit ribosomal protein S16